MTSLRATAAVDLMDRFARRTGLAAGEPCRRYLWTDAFAVCNFLGLQAETSDASYRDLALRLVEQVHGKLGRHREDDGRSGWLSGSSEAEGALHPTRGGLRIGKPLPERRPTEALDLDAEWDRDGQYFHYLTKWAHALDQVARATGDVKFHFWACDLMETAHRAFTYGPPGRRRMVWKVSIDLSRALVPSMGQHDALDGFATCVAIKSFAARACLPITPGLARAEAEFEAMIDLGSLATTDALGIGGLLFDAWRLLALEPPRAALFEALLPITLGSLRSYLRSFDPHAPASGRLAFRELGLSIGLVAASMLREGPWMDRLDPRAREWIADLASYTYIRDEIEAFWLSPANQRAQTWDDHRDINEVMLATSLLPDGFFSLGEDSRAVNGRR